MVSFLRPNLDVAAGEQLVGRSRIRRLADREERAAACVDPKRIDIGCRRRACTRFTVVHHVKLKQLLVSDNAGVEVV